MSCCSISLDSNPCQLVPLISSADVRPRETLAGPPETFAYVRELSRMVGHLDVQRLSVRARPILRQLCTA